MLRIENIDTYGWEAAIRGMRNPKNSWGKSDSRVCESSYAIGEDDFALMKRLANAGTDHGKFLRMIAVTLDVIAPLYWWKEFDTYKVGTVANSCSTMHKIADKEFTPEDFSTEHLVGNSFAALQHVIDTMNLERRHFVITGDNDCWWQMIQLLPTSYNQRRTVMLNYAVLKNIYEARRNHKLDEWHTFCDWIETLPYFELIGGKTMPDLRIDRVSGSGEDALYNVYHENRLVYAGVSMSEVLRYLSNIHEDESDE